MAKVSKNMMDQALSSIGRMSEENEAKKTNKRMPIPSLVGKRVSLGVDSSPCGGEGEVVKQFWDAEKTDSLWVHVQMDKCTAHGYDGDPKLKKHKVFDIDVKGEKGLVKLKIVDWHEVDEYRCYGVFTPNPDSMVPFELIHMGVIKE